MTKPETPATTIVLHGRLSFPDFVTPRRNPLAAADAAPKYGCMLLLPPNTDLRPIQAAILAAATATFGAQAQKVLAGLAANKKPLRRVDMDAPWAADLPDGGEGWFVLRCTSKRQPGCVDGKVKPMQPSEFYAGCWVNLQVHAFGYAKGEKGVSWGLDNVQFVKNDERLGSGAPPATSAFTALQGDDSVDPGTTDDDHGLGDILG